MKHYSTASRSRDDEARQYENYYVNQCGHGMPVFYGARGQRGHGIGAVLGGLWRTVFPILKRIAPIIGRKVLKTGAQIARDVSDGRSFEESAKTHVLNAVEEGINKIIPAPAPQSGSGIRRRAATKRKRQIGSGKPKKKRRKRSDIFS